jgi:RNA polymerase sigma-70 factor (sigma-E family)
MESPIRDPGELETLRHPAQPLGLSVSFDEFVATRSTRLLRTAYLLTRDYSRAEDLLQTALAKAWLSWRHIHSDADGYVRKVMVNTYATWWRRRWNDETPAVSLPEPAVDAGDDSLRQDLWAALGRLPRGQRAVVVLRYFEDLTEAETARVLGCSVGTVKSQTARAFIRLRIDDALLEGRELR